MTIKSLLLSQIRIDGGTQQRAEMEPERIKEYAERKQAGDKFPPLAIFFDGAEYWLADGFYRWHAWSLLELPSIECDVRDGSQRDAILFSVSANSEHGKNRSPADKRKAVKTLLEDDEWSGRSAKWIADTCRVGQHLVAKVLEEMMPKESTSRARSSTGKDGKTRPSRQQKAKFVCETCTRKGIRPGCLDCAAGGGGKRKTAKPSKPKQPKNGAEVFDWKLYDSTLGAYARAVKRLVLAFKLGVEGAGLERKFSEFLQDVQAVRERVQPK